MPRHSINVFQHSMTGYESATIRCSQHVCMRHVHGFTQQCARLENACRAEWCRLPFSFPPGCWWGCCSAVVWLGCGTFWLAVVRFGFCIFWLLHVLAVTCDMSQSCIYCVSRQSQTELIRPVKPPLLLVREMTPLPYPIKQQKDQIDYCGYIGLLM